MPFDLNEEQEAAASALRGPVIISAGAGSGKTRTLSERFARALVPDQGEEWAGASPSQILTITFTEKAAGELAERIRSTLKAEGLRQDAQEVDNAWISTIHGFCSRILKRYALEAGLDPAFGVVETVTAARLRDQAFEQASIEMLDTPEGQALFGDFEFSAVYEGVETVVHALRTRGLPSSALELEHARDARAVCQEAIGVLFTAAQEIAGCGDDGKLAAGFCVKCRSAADELTALEQSELAPHELAGATWRVLAEFKFGRSSKKMQEMHESAAAEITRLTAEAATAAALPYAAAMERLVDRFMDAHAQGKRAHGLLDFDDLQLEVLRLFETHPHVLAECRKLFTLSMVDEFQDTDALQLALVNAVAGEHLCTVGDEHQSIYGFRGADVDVFRDHEKAMMAQGGRKRRLFANYRSHRDILTFVNTLFSSDVLFGKDLEHLTPGRIEPNSPCLPVGEPRVDVVLVHEGGGTSDLYRQAEARSVAQRFAALRDDHGFKGGDMVLLSRTYTHAEVYAAELRARGFDVAVVGGSRFLTLPEVVTMRMLVRCIANPRDEVALLHLLSSDAGRLSDDALLLLRRASGSIWESLQEPPGDLDGRDLGRIQALVSAVIDARNRLGHVALSEIVLRATEDLGLDLLYLSQGDVGRQAYANVLKLARLAGEFEDGVGAGPAAFAAHLDAREEYGEHTPPATLGDADSTSVRFMSIHSAKGLEFPVVAVVGLGSGAPGDSSIVRVGAATDGGRLSLSARLPSSKSTRKQAERPALFARLDSRAKAAEAEEGKRLFYVATTRAREVLVLSGLVNAEKEPSESQTMLNWLRSSPPGITAPVGQGPRLERIADCLVRTETVEASVEPSEEPPRCDTEPREPSVTIEAASRGRMVLPAPEQLSYTDLALYGECAKRFWAARVLRVGSLTIETQSDPRRLGSALHSVLQLAGTEMPDEARIVAIATHYRLSETDTQQVRDAAERFLTSSAGLRLASHHFSRREWSFAVDLSTEGVPLMLAGAIDAYGRTGDQGLIVDYKSGSSGEEQELRARYELQARCYALVALRDGCSQVSVVFARPEVPTPGGGCQEVEYQFLATDLAEIEAQVREAHGRMRAGEYLALPKWDPHVCKACPILGTLCEVRAPVRRSPAG